MSKPPIVKNETKTLGLDAQFLLLVRFFLFKLFNYTKKLCYEKIITSTSVLENRQRSTLLIHILHRL